MYVSNIERYLEIGAKDKDWFQKCEDTFCEIFGRDKLWLVTRLFAATSINTSLKANITLFRKALYEITHDLPVGNYLPNIQSQLYQIRSGADLTGRKIRAFAAAMSGDINAVVVDTWLLRAFKMNRGFMRHSGPHEGLIREGGATDKQYTMIENYVRSLAQEMGIEPREVSSMIWAGVRIDISGDYNTRYDTILKNTFNNLFNVI